MDSTASASPPNTTPPDEAAPGTFWQKLLHRWLVEYNPTYLLSAALVLAGVILLSRGLAREGTLYGQIGVAAIAEVYAFALIGGAAVLTRIGLRRPAVMLALLTALYQGDLTLHTETCAYLGKVGGTAALLWLALFVGKLLLLARAVQLRLSWSAIAVPTLGALGLVVLPRFFHEVDPATLTTLAALWVFTLFSAALWSSKRVDSRIQLDPQATQILRRALRATWLMWGILTLFHVLFWSSEYGLHLVVLLPVALLLATRWIKPEWAVWAVVSATLLFVAAVIPASFSTAALMAAAVLALRALRQPSVRTPEPSCPPSATPYRTHADDSPPPRPAPQTVFSIAARPALLRLLTGSLFALYLSAWTINWTGGMWPHHVLPLDLVFTLAGALLVWKAHARLVLAPMTASCLHFAVQTGLISAPESTLQWGATSIVLGFGLLVTSVLVSWRLNTTGAPSGPASEATGPAG